MVIEYNTRASNGTRKREGLDRLGNGAKDGGGEQKVAPNGNQKWVGLDRLCITAIIGGGSNNAAWNGTQEKERTEIV